MKQFWGKNWFVLILILTFFLRLPSLFEPFIYGDEGVYLTLGLGIRKGLLLYRDIYDNKPPLLYLVAALAKNFAYFRLALFGWAMVTIFFFRELAATVFPKNKAGIIFSTAVFAILTSIHTFEGNVANAENFMILPTIIGFIIFLRAKTKTHYFLSGILFSLAFLFKVPAAFDFAAVLVFSLTIMKNKKEMTSQAFIAKLIYLSVGFFLPILLTLLFFATKGALGEYLKAAFFQNLPYLSSWNSNSSKVSSFPLALALRTLIVIVISGAVMLFKQSLPKEYRLVVLWFAFTLFASLLSGRPYPHYLLQTIPALSLSTCLLFSKKKGLPLILITILIITFLDFKFWHYENISYYQNFYRFALGGKTKEQYFDYFGNNAQSLYSAAIHIKARSNADEKIFIWGNQPSLYSLAERLPVGRYTVAYHIVDFGGYRETIQALEKTPPRFIVITGDEIRDFPAFFALIQNSYRTEFQIGDLRILHQTIQTP